MTTTHSYPSRRFPQFPQVAFGTPDDWTPATVPGAVLAARADRPPDRFAPNVVVTVGRHAGPFGREEALAMLHGALRDHAEAKVDEPFVAPFGPDRYLVVNAAFDDPRVGTLVQVHAYSAFPVPGRSDEHDIVHVMGTCSAAETADDYPLLQQVMESVRVSTAPSGA